MRLWTKKIKYNTKKIKSREDLLSYRIKLLRDIQFKILFLGANL